MAVRYQRVVEEDLDLGTGTVDVVMPGGGTAVGHRIGPQSFTTLGFIASMAGGQNITGGAAAATVALATEELDVASWYNNATYTFLPNVDGYYQIDAYLKLAAFTGTATVAIYKNSAAVVSTAMVRTAAAGEVTISALVALNGSSDTITLKVSHNDGVNLREVQAARMSGYLTGRAVAA